MEKLEQWCSVLCIICVMTGVMMHIIPDGKLKKCVNIVYTLLILTTVVSIIGDVDHFDIDIEYSNYNSATYSNDLYSYVTAEAEEKIKKELNNELKLICEYDFKIKLKWTITDSTYQLSEIILTVSEQDIKNVNKIKSKTSELTGVIPEVVTTNEY